MKKIKEAAMTAIVILAAIVLLGCPPLGGAEGDVPDAPTGLAVSGTPTSSSVVLTWTAAAGATGYRVYRAGTQTGTFTQTGPDVTSGTTMTNGSLTAATTYWYQVSAYNADGEGEKCAAISATTAAGGGGGSVPDAPTGLAVSGTPTSSSVALTWTAVADATGYRVYRSGTQTGTYAQTGTDVTTGTTLTDGGLAASTPYWYKVSAYNAQGEGAQCAAISATTAATTSGNYPAGAFDTGFVGSGCSYLLAGNNYGRVQALAVQGDGKVIVGGYFESYNGSANAYLVRVNSDGTLDTTFNTGGAGPNGEVKALLIQGDGRILIGGSFSTYNGTTYPRFARLNADGSLDTTLAAPVSSSALTVFCMARQSDGKILLGCQAGGVRRLNSDLSLDTTFTTTSDDWVFAVGVQSDGKIVVGGQFSTFNGVTQGRITRLNADGSLDTSFNPSGVGLKTAYTGGSQVSAIKVLPNGKILITGDMYRYNATSYAVNPCATYIARLNADGTLDTTFSTSPAFIPNTNNATWFIYSMVVQGDGKIVIGGSFPGTYFTTARARIARLNADGSLDTSFDPGTGFDGVTSNVKVLALALQSDGTLYAGGQFLSYNGTSQSGLVRIK